MKIKRMNKAVKQLWVKALRSGKYKKGTCQLRSYDNRFCCLGVLTDLWRHEAKPDWDSDVDIPKINGFAAGLPSFVKEWAGLEEENPYVGFCKSRVDLATLNDDGFDESGPLPFKKIADLIEKQL